MCGTGLVLTFSEVFKQCWPLTSDKWTHLCFYFWGVPMAQVPDGGHHTWRFHHRPGAHTHTHTQSSVDGLKFHVTSVATVTGLQRSVKCDQTCVKSLHVEKMRQHQTNIRAAWKQRWEEDEFIQLKPMKRRNWRNQTVSISGSDERNLLIPRYKLSCPQWANYLFRGKLVKAAWILKHY